MLKYEVIRDGSWLEYTRYGEEHRDDGFALITEPMSDGTFYLLKVKYGEEIAGSIISTVQEHQQCLNIMLY